MIQAAFSQNLLSFKTLLLLEFERKKVLAPKNNVFITQLLYPALKKIKKFNNFWGDNTLLVDI
jgi:hypothetical protein